MNLNKDYLYLKGESVAYAMRTTLQDGTLIVCVPTKFPRFFFIFFDRIQACLYDI